MTSVFLASLFAPALLAVASSICFAFAGGEVFGSALTGLAGGVGGYLWKRIQAKIDIQRKVAETENKMRQSMRQPLPLPVGHKRNTIMVVGEGGSGKTTLIQRLIDPKVTQVTKTEDYSIWNGTRSMGASHLNLVLSDYKGQDIGTLVRAFIAQQLEPHSPMRFGYVNTLIFVVDVIDPRSHTQAAAQGEIPRYASFDRKRIAHQLDLWNRMALDAIFGMHGFEKGLTRPGPTSRRGLRQVILLINKMDLLAANTPEMERAVIAAYQSLIDDLRRRSRLTSETTGEVIAEADFKVIIGSVDRGDALPKVLDRLTEHAVPDIPPIPAAAKP